MILTALSSKSDRQLYKTPPDLPRRSGGVFTVLTSVAEAQTHRPQDLVQRNFTATRPNQLWVSDFTSLAESINALFKVEVIHHEGPSKGLEDVEYATLKWVAWYNSQRLMEPLG